MAGGFKRVEFFSAVIVYSKNPTRLAKFYREVLGIPVEEENHGDIVAHYGCELGDIHFAIQPFGPTENPQVGNRVKLAFEIFDMAGFIEHMRFHGFEPFKPPHVLGGGSLLASFWDLDGNEIEFTQLAPEWFRHLERRKQAGHDLIERFNQMNRSTR